MLVKDFRELRATVERMGLLEPNQLFFFLLLAHILLLDTAAWLILFYFGTSLLPFVFSLLLLTISQVSNGFHGRDFHQLTHTHVSSILSFVFSLGTVSLCYKNTATIWEEILHVGILTLHLVWNSFKIYSGGGLETVRIPQSLSAGAFRAISEN